MKTLIAAAVLAITCFAPSALASSRGNAVTLRSAKAAVRADAAARGLKDPSKIILTGESFTILSSGSPTPTAKPIDRVMASGTIDRATGKVTSFNPILME